MNHYIYRCHLCGAEGDAAASELQASLTLALHYQQRHKVWTTQEAARLTRTA